MTHADQSAPAFFEEEQRFRQWWIWIPVVLCALLPVVVYVPPFNRIPTHGNVTIGVIVAVVVTGIVVLTFGLARLTVRVTPQELQIRYFPFFVDRQIAVHDILHFEVLRYNPLLAGYGVHYSPYGLVYNVGGKEGVQLLLRDGKRVLVGTLRPQEFSAALTQAGAGKQ